MKFFIVASFLFVGAIASPVVLLKAEDDGQWKGEGLLESQDWEQLAKPTVYASAWAQGIAAPWTLASAPLSLAAAPLARLAAPAIWTAGAPLGPDGRVVDTPEVAIAKAEHFAAKANAAVGATPLIAAAPLSPLALAAPTTYAAWAPALWAGKGAAPIGLDGRVVDTPEVAIAKAAHFAAKAAAVNQW